MIHKASTYIHAGSNFFVVGPIEPQSFEGHQALWFSLNGVVADQRAFFDGFFLDLRLLAVCTCAVDSLPPLLATVVYVFSAAG